MSDAASLLNAIDRLCGQIATAIQHAELHIYATLALIIFLGVVIFPPKDDLDQV